MKFFDRFKKLNKKKKIVPIIFVVDSSKSIAGEKILCVNNVIKKACKYFDNYNKSKTNKQNVKVGVLKYSSGSQWHTKGLADPSKIKVIDVSQNNSADLGSALIKLDNEFVNDTIINELPIIFFICNERPTDNCAFEFERLNDNSWYKASRKFAIVIGDAIEDDIFKDINEVFKMNSINTLEREMSYCIIDAFNENETNVVGFNKNTDCDEWFVQRCEEFIEDDGQSDFDKSYEYYYLEQEFDNDEPAVTDSNSASAPRTQIPDVTVSQVQFSAVVPKCITKGEYSMIDISVYEEMYRNVVDSIIANADGEVREVIASSQKVVENTEIKIILSSPDVDLSDCEEAQKWQGKYLTFSFPVEIPSNYAKKQILFIASVYFDNLIATKLKFIVDCTSVREQKLQLTREDVLTAFISYASQDRSRVATVIQGMKKARPDMDIFFDVESLRSGDDWEKTLRAEIEKRDILFLCWSNFAKDSEWVEKEWRYALSNKGIDAIEPIPLVSPAECPPPEELNAKHFNDRALLYQGI